MGQLCFLFAILLVLVHVKAVRHIEAKYECGKACRNKHKGEEEASDCYRRMCSGL
ncbi:hypothetical protein TELCIR_00645 [Teladorsagia circumcincta]|uniref:Uncharacterized protein n=1 Tax=Teladorsagia circumcincta TaxID=45464 RepID=A0A2G9V408_TELCI|nr:hypothetical protein TELCIR_00645 [Teladorsagia circumcincta]